MTEKIMTEQKARVPTDEEVDALIEATHKKKRASRTRVFKRDLPGSWSRFVLSLISIALVCSDIPRSGLGYKHLEKLYPPMYPDVFDFFGTPWNYSIIEMTRADAASKSARVWSYKFDSTSYSWRAFARYFKLDTFPTCLLYQSECPQLRLGGESVFAMIDSLASAMAKLKTSDNSSVPSSVSVRTDGIYRDRVHNFILPELFMNHNWRTNQAMHYSGSALSKVVEYPHQVCYAHGYRPNFCADQWIDFRRSCPATDEVCKAVGLIYIHIISRVRDAVERFPNLTIDLTLLESNEDMQSVRGGLSTVAVRRSDVSTIIRARDCSSATKECKTMWLNDYRYETGMLVTDARQWYYTTSLLRIVGQSYFYFRVFGLILSCYVVQAPKTSSAQSLSLKARLKQTLRLFSKVPTQCIVYGSPFPIFCYAFAHLIDASISSSVLEHRFVTQNGALDFSIKQFVSLAVVQMRNVWLYAIILHVVLQSGVAQRWIGWYRKPGIFGVPEFLLSALSSVTISAQFRSRSYRVSKILGVYEVATCQRHSLPNIKYFESIQHRGSGNTFMGGITIDLKYLICEVGLILGAIIVTYSILTVLRKSGVWKKAPLPSELVQTHTPVPYSAGILWPSISLCVHWTYDYFSVRTENMDRTRTSSGFAVISPHKRRLHADAKPSAKLQHSVKSFIELAKYPSTHLDRSAFKYIQFQMEVLHNRRSDVEGNIAFMNLVLMSDPIVFFYLRVAGGRVRQLAYYQSMLFPSHIVLLPRRVVVEDNEQSVGFRLLRPVAVRDLPWSELVQCG